MIPSNRKFLGLTHSPGMPPIVSASNVTSSRGETLSMRASNCSRASTPRGAPLVGLTNARMVAATSASRGSSGCMTAKSFDGGSVADLGTISSLSSNLEKRQAIQLRSAHSWRRFNGLMLLTALRTTLRYRDSAPEGRSKVHEHAELCEEDGNSDIAVK